MHWGISVVIVTTYDNIAMALEGFITADYCIPFRNYGCVVCDRLIPANLPFQVSFVPINLNVGTRISIYALQVDGRVFFPLFARFGRCHRRHVTQVGYALTSDD